jgi:Na+/alanine symporter
VPFMQAIIFTILTVAVLGIARPHILKVTSAITERAVGMQKSLQARFARKANGG